MQVSFACGCQAEDAVCVVLLVRAISISSKGILPLQFWEAGEVGICGDQFATVFYREKPPNAHP